MDKRLTWNSTLETGVRQIDLQHQELIALINELEIEHELGRDEDALKIVLPRLKAYVLFHFSTEENLMAGVAEGTPHAVGHIIEHRKFTDKVATFQIQPWVDPGQTALQLLDYLKSWLVNHIMITDKQLAGYILSHRRN